MKFCTKCGSPVTSDIKFCKECGNPIKNDNINSEKIQENKVNLSNKENDTVRVGAESYNNRVQFEKQVEEVRDKNYIQRPEGNYNGSINQKQNIRHYESNNIDNGFSRNKGVAHKPKNNVTLKIIAAIIAGIILIIAILSGIFFDRIRGEYYIIKANDSVSLTDKLNYSIKAVKVLDSDTTKDLLKNTLVEIAKNDVELAEQKLNEVTSLLSQGDYKNIATGIKDKKIDKLFKDGKYQEAVAEFGEVDKLGGDFKANKNYEDIMLNVISKITNTPLSNTRNLLMEDKKICFDNFDDDPFDEIIELKSDNKYSYNSGIKLNLYKFKNGQYKLVNAETIERAWNEEIQGIYNYADGKKGLFIHYVNRSNNVGTSVFGVNSDRLQLKGAVFGNNYTKPDDADGDGIYEVLSNSTSVVASVNKDTSKWYKIYEDGRTPTEVTVNQGDKTKSNSKANTNPSSSEYIFKDSDKAYLTEEDLRGLSKEQLALARNEIFARHGYVFNDAKFKSYFTAKSWYVPNASYDGSDSTLNEYEKANYQLIQTWEKK